MRDAAAVAVEALLPPRLQDQALQNGVKHMLMQTMINTQA